MQRLADESLERFTPLRADLDVVDAEDVDVRQRSGFGGAEQLILGRVGRAPHGVGSFGAHSSGPREQVFTFSASAICLEHMRSAIGGTRRTEGSEDDDFAKLHFWRLR